MAFLEDHPMLEWWVLYSAYQVVRNTKKIGNGKISLHIMTIKNAV